MDNPTKVGIGSMFAGGALTLALVLWPQVPRPLGYAGLAVCLIGMTWGFVPIFRPLFASGGLINIPMSEAARIAYENSEKNIIGFAAYRLGDTAEQTLAYFFHAFLLNGVPIYATKPPSTRLRRVPPDEAKRLHPVGALDSAGFLHERSKATYTNLSVKRWDLWRVVRHFKSQPENFPPIDLRDRR